MKFKLTFLLLLSLLALPVDTHAQFLKKLKEKVENFTEETLKGVDLKNSEKIETVKEEKIPESITTAKTPQSATENNTMASSKNEGSKLMIVAPNENFDNIELVAYRGLPILNSNYLNDNTDSYPEQPKYSFKRYQMLVGLKYMKSFFMTMNKETFINNETISSLEGNINKSLQDFIKQMASYTVAQELWPRYFCQDSEGSECRITMTRLGYRQKSSSLNWGGMNATAFDRQRIYKDFIDTHLNTLINWSQNMFENDVQEGYLTFDISLYMILKKRDTGSICLS